MPKWAGERGAFDRRLLSIPFVYLFVPQSLLPSTVSLLLLTTLGRGERKEGRKRMAGGRTAEEEEEERSQQHEDNKNAVATHLHTYITQLCILPSKQLHFANRAIGFNYVEDASKS
jgi:hypothetical protein